MDAPDLLLRSERKGNGDGRVYLAVVTATTTAGSATACVTVVVPKANTAASIADVRAQALAAEAICDVTGTAPAGFFLVGEGSLAPTNHAPVVDAGPDQTAGFPAPAVPLEATVVDDGFPAGTVLVTWSKLSGPGAVSFADAHSVDTTASFGTMGTYVLRLAATDGQLTAADETNVSVGSANHPPVVSAGPIRASRCPRRASLCPARCRTTACPWAVR